MRDALCASLLQPARYSAFLIRVGVSILVHSLMLSSQLFACRPRFRPPSNVPCRMVLGRLLWRVTWPNHVSFLLLMVARRGSCGPALDAQSRWPCGLTRRSRACVWSTWPGNNLVQITCNTSSAYHVQPVVCSTWYKGAPQLFNLTEFKSLLFELYFIGWTINRWRRGGNRSTRRKPLTTSIRICHILKPEDSSPKRDSNLHSGIGGRLGKQMC